MIGGLRRLRLEGGLVLLGTLLCAAALAASLHDWPRTIAAHPWEVAAFALAIAVGEHASITLPGNRAIAPVSTAAALAFAMAGRTAGDAPLSLSGWFVIAVTALSVGVGNGAIAVRGWRVPLVELMPRLIGVSVAVGLARFGPWHSRSVLDLQREGAALLASTWTTALAMLLLCAAALSAHGLVSALIQKGRDHAPLRRAFVDEVHSLGALAAALSATSVLIVTAMVAVGALAVPLLLAPLFVTQSGVRRFAANRVTYLQTIRSLSRLTDLSGYTEPGHAERVAVLARAVGRELGMSARDIVDLEYAALLHDIGQVSLTVPIPKGATVQAAPANQRRIASDGAEIVRKTGVLDAVAVILEAQSTPYRQVREYGEDLPLASRIIKVCNAFDDFAEGARGPALRAQALERIHLGLGYEYDPRVVDSLSRVLGRGSV